jgi:NADH-quinone oxidoreductase subunit G
VSCATPVKDGMVVYTQSERVKQAQNAIVEFLLVNHPLDCPVCDKGGECPLQDISYGWGPGKSRFIEPKRNFPKPIALSPLVAIDRERCILCYRCVRFSQEVAEDDQLTFLDRADHTFVGTFDGRPYVAPFSGNIIELCPVGALTSTAYRFRARPWDIENAGSVCTLCPSQCNVSFSVRDGRVERVLARDNSEVDDGWLCDKGRFAYQAIHSEQRIVQPLVRDGGLLRPVSWERALEAAATGLGKAGARSAAIVGGATTNEEGYLLQRLFRDALGSGSIDSRTGGVLEPASARLLTRPELSARVADIDQAAVVLVVGADPINESPILDLRLRKAVGRFGATLLVAAAHPTALDGGATERLAYVPGGEEAFLRAFAKTMLEVDRGSHDHPATAGARELDGQRELLEFLARLPLESLTQAAGTDVGDLRDAAGLLVGAESLVIVWGERLGHGEGGPGALRALLDLALLAGVDGSESSGLIEVPVQSNARGLREVGCLPNLAPGLVDVDFGGLSAAQARDAARSGDLSAFYLLHADPLREHPDRAAWEQALGTAFVVAHDQFVNESVERHADVVFPAESYAEKEGTVTHPDGRLQRARPAIGRPGAVRPESHVLTELAGRLGLEIEHRTAAAVLAEIGDQVPFYRGITNDEIGPKGVRWQEREQSLVAARALDEPRFGSPSDPRIPPEPGDGALRLAGVSLLWAAWETERSPALDFLSASQEVQLNPSDADRLGIAHGGRVAVTSNGNTLEATARLRQAAPPGCACLFWGTAAGNANALLNGAPTLVDVKPIE